MTNITFNQLPFTHVRRVWTQIWMIMRLITLLIIISTLTTSAKSYSQNVSLALQKVPVKSALSQIREQTGCSFLWNENTLEGLPPVSISVRNASLADAVKATLKGLPLTYEVHGNVVYIERKVSVPEVTVQTPIPPLNSITGLVTDSATGNPLVGVTVKVKGGKMGTVTDVEGKFSLEVPDDAVLEVSYLGYVTKEIALNGREVVHIALSAVATGLDQIVVVGYGTQKKRDVTGSISQINFDEEGLNNLPVTNVAKAIQGRIPNANVTIPTGRPGVGGAINVRGYNSINGGSPLVLVDGVEQSLNDISPSDVKTVTVLKDAGAAAIYGARAAYGVILIETKSGKAGKPKISYSTNYGVATQTQKTDYITKGYDEVMIWDEAMQRTLGNTVTGYTQHDYDELEARRYDKYQAPGRPWALVENRNGKDQFVYYGNFDWHSYLYQQYQPYYKHSLNVSGGSDKINYYLSGDIRRQDGIWKIQPDIYHGQNLRAKIEAKLYPWLKISNNASFYHYKYNYSRFNTFAFGSSINDFYSPSYMPFNPDGTSTYSTGMGPYQIGYGQHAAFQDGNMNYFKSFYEFRNTTAVDLNFFKNKLNIHADYTGLINQTPEQQRRIKVPYSLYPGEIQIIPKYSDDRLVDKTTTVKRNMINAYASFKDHFGSHNFYVMGGGNFSNYNYKMTQGIGYDLLSETLSDLSLSTDNPQVDGSQSEWDLLGFFGRFTYNYNSKYYFQFNGRYDGTSRFPKSDRFGFFPSFSAAWDISQEPFFENLKNKIDQLKLRASYGSLGNQDVGTYAYISTMSTTTSAYLIDNVRMNYTGMPTPVSGSLTWEKVTSQNIGLDMSVLDGRLTGSLDGYIRNTTGMLSKGKTLPAVYGASEPDENAANLRTKGWEITLNWKNSFDLFEKEFKYSVKVGVSDYTGEITKFDNPDSLISDYYVGQKLGDIWGFTVDGYFKTQDEADNYPVNQQYVNKRIEAAPPQWRGLKAGDMKFVDLDGDNIIGIGRNTVSDPGDRRIIGNSTPRYQFSLSLGGSWNNFDLSAFFMGVVHQNWYPGKEATDFWGPYTRPYTSFIPTNFSSLIWSEDNPNSYFPLLRGYVANNGELYFANNKYLQDIGYVRLKNLSIGYSIPKDLLKRVHVQGLRIYFSGDDLFTLSKLDTKYIDPEQVGAGDYGHSQDDARIYPFSTKMFSFGLDVTF